MRQRRCSDCGVEMAPVDFFAGSYQNRVRTAEKRDGILGTLGANETYEVDAVMCPECGQVRLYADLED